jgi:hypothetical protein
MSNEPNPPPAERGGRDPSDLLQAVDDKARALARRLLAETRFGALAVLEPGTGHPLASRTAVAPDVDGAPLMLMSGLAAHTTALAADPRCSLLLGEPGSGDPLAYPRVTVIGVARRLERDTEAGAIARERYLALHPKAALYADFGDFAFWRLDVLRASLNAGFGRAYALRPEDVLHGA